MGAGDFNADGYAELAIGTPTETVVEDFIGEGAVNVLYGASGGLSATTIPDQLWSQGSPNVEGTPNSDDDFGYAVAS